MSGWMLVYQTNAESVVQAIVCSEGASLAITQPVSDSVIVTTTLPLAGMVTQANQIEITIDGQFDGVVPLNAAATTFATTVQLSPGTHTIRLTAIDACQIANATDQVVVTYQAPPTDTAGSVGGETATTLPASGGVVVGGTPLLSGASTIAPTPLQRLAQPLIDLGRNLDLMSAPSQTTSQQTTIPQMVRFSFVVIGLGSIIFATYIAQFVSALHFRFIRLGAVRRLVPTVFGVGLLVLAFLL